MSGTSDFQTLLASLKSSQSQASVDLNTPKAQPATPQDSARRNVVSFFPLPAPQEKSATNTQSKNERSQNLLNLLKFSNSTASKPDIFKPHAMGNEQSTAAPSSHMQGKKEAASIHKGKQDSSKDSDQTSQDALLKLLQRSVSSSSQPKSIEVKAPEQAPFSFNPQSASNAASVLRLSVGSPYPQDEAERKSSPIRMFGSAASRENTPFDPPAVTASKEIKPPFSFNLPTAGESKEKRSPFPIPTHVENLQASRHATPQAVPPRSASPLIFPSIEVPASTENDKSEDISDSQVNARRKLVPKGRGKNGRHATPEVKKETEPTITPDTKAAVAEAETVTCVKIKKEDDDTAAGLAALAEKLKQANIGSAPAGATKAAETEAANSGPQISKDLRPDATVTSPEKGQPVEARNGAPPETQDSTDLIVQIPSRKIPIYNFPLKPFVSIIIIDLPTPEMELGEVIEVSRFKKDFDQADRSLVSASSSYIAYGFVKHGGVRLIRQDDGMGIHVFKESGDRVFNVAVCATASTGPASPYQTVIAAGLSGAVFYATISKVGQDLFNREDVVTESLIFPPTLPDETNTSDGQVKSRVRRSSRHPEFFGLGRGSTIRIIWPATALSIKYGVSGDDRAVDTEKFYQDRDLKITCPRAQKDFIFSEDDTVIASLDKHGKLSFWDIQALTEEGNATATKVHGENITTPLMIFSTAPQGSKGAPTSVLFVDKLRAYTKGIAQRYMLVGYKQNHVLQLWDLTLRRMVQEIQLPQETERDAVCSVSFHPETGIIVVGHPTRNSIFFIQLSTPKYDSIPLTQAGFVEQLARERQPREPKATACLSGIRELSFSQKGHLRSVEIVSHQKTDDAKTSTGGKTKFEVYVAHSKGVTCLAIKNEDLGWDEDGKELRPINNGQKTGVFKFGELPVMENPDSDARDSSLAPGIPPNSKPSKKKTTKSLETRAAVVQKIDEDRPSSEPFVESTNGTAGLDANEAGSSNVASGKKKKKDKSVPSVSSNPKSLENTKSSVRSTSPSRSPIKPSGSSDQTLPLDKAPVYKHGDRLESVGHEASVAAVGTGSKTGVKAEQSVGIDVQSINKVVGNFEARVLKGVEDHLNKLHSQLEDERRVTEATGNTRQEAILRLVSSTLSDNVENALHRIVKQQIEQQVVPTVIDATSQTICSELGHIVNKSLGSLIPKQIDAHLVSGLTQALQGSAFTQNLADGVRKSLQPALSSQFQDLLHKTVVPKFEDMAVQAALKVTLNMEGRFAAEFRRFEVDRATDASKIDKLQSSLEQVTEMVSRMSQSQVAFQEKLLSDRRTPEDFGRSAEAFHRPASSSATAIRPTPQASRSVSGVLPSPIAPPSFHSRSGTVLPSPIGPPSTKTPEQLEIEEIRGMLEQRKYEAAAIKWLQSTRASAVFDEAFMSYSPDFLTSAVSPLVAFSVGVTVANSFERNIVDRLHYIYTSLQPLDVSDPEIQSLAAHAPQLLSSLLSKLEKPIRDRDGKDWWEDSAR